MEKFLRVDFFILLLLAAILVLVHEFGHYLAYKVLGYECIIRKSILVPGIDPKHTIEVSKIEGLIIALSGFFISTITIIGPCILFEYKLWFPFLLGSIVGSSVDYIWAFSMILKKQVTIYSR